MSARWKRRAGIALIVLASLALAGVWIAGGAQLWHVRNDADADGPAGLVMWILVTAGILGGYGYAIINEASDDGS